MDTLLRNSGLAFGAALIAAVLDWIATARNWRRAECVFKPATLILVWLAAWLITRGPHDTWIARFFLPGLLLSLAGDVLLLVPGPRFFMLGLVAFLLAHVCYILGLNATPPPLASAVVLIIIAAVGAWLYRGLAAGLRSKGQLALRAPVAAYSAVLALMLFSAWATLFRPGWTPLQRGLVIVGATAFFISDSMLAWSKFVRPLPGGHAASMVIYHLAQFSLAASIASV